MWECSQQHQNRDEAKFCAKCGEKHVVPTLCSACGTVLEPEDMFCTSCGQKREAAPAASAPAPAPVAVPPPPPVSKAVVEAPAPVAQVQAEEPAAEEPVTFSFGGALIEMKDDKKKPAAPAQAAAAGTSSGARMSSAQSAILSFVLFAAVLGAALYFVSR